MKRLWAKPPAAQIRWFSAGSSALTPKLPTGPPQLWAFPSRQTAVSRRPSPRCSDARRTAAHGRSPQGHRSTPRRARQGCSTRGGWPAHAGRAASPKDADTRRCRCHIVLHPVPRWKPPRPAIAACWAIAREAAERTASPADGRRCERRFGAPAQRRSPRAEDGCQRGALQWGPRRPGALPDCRSALPLARAPARHRDADREAAVRSAIRR